jgi:foldase protein PrsA
MRRAFRIGATLAVALLPLTAAWAGKPAEPQVVVVQHVLVGFKNSVQGKAIGRTKAEAGALAETLLERARAGEEFDALVREYTDDRHPGIYKLTNTGAPRMSGARTREQMVTGFGDVAFRLAVGEVGIVPYHASSSPYGWHVVKRLE